MSRPVVIYFHGMGSSGTTSEKAAFLRKYYTVYAPDIPMGYYQAMEHLLSFVKDVLIAHRLQNVVLVGSSLGGYWASRMADCFRLPCVLINPSCNPGPRLPAYGYAEESKDYAPLAPIADDLSRIVLLSTNDEVLDYTEAYKVFDQCASVRLFADGGHRFENHDANILRAIVDSEEPYI
jgi:predicted esterase YcpF (UPF0227 family)